MGFFSFLASKREADDTSSLNGGLDIKAQPYDSTAVALPPIRGALPVAGNGPNTLDDLKRAARKRSEAQLSARTTTEPSAPPPMVPRLRSKSFGRPSTAPSVPSDPVPNQRPKSAGRNSNRPPFLVQKTTPGPPYLLGMTGPENEDPEDNTATDIPPPVPPIAAHFMKDASAPSSPVTGTPTKKGPGSIAGSFVSGRSAGTGTVGTGGASGGVSGAGHVDLLDAQGAFRPSDFKTRLRAAGARDYGEDVAERNIGVNGVDLNSPAVLAFYALTGGGPLAYKSDGSAVDVHGNKYSAGNIPSDLATTVEGKGRDELSALANKSIRTPRFPERTTSLQPQPHVNSIPGVAGDLAVRGGKAGKADDSGPRRRTSVHGGPVTSKSQHKLRPLSMHPVTSNFSFDPANAPEVPRSRPTTSPGPSDLPSKASFHSKSRDSTSTASKKKQQQKDERPRSRSLKGGRSIASLATSQQHRDTESEEGEPAKRPRSVSSASRKSRKPKHEDDLGQFNFGVPSTGNHIPAVPSSRFSSRPGSSGGVQADSRHQGQWKASHVGQVRTEEQSQPRPSTSSAAHPRNRSIGAASLRGRTQLDDIDELIPGHRSSWRNESVSSVAPSSTATASSNISSKHSRHTADTSLDLGYSLPSAQKPAPGNGIMKKSHTRGKSSGTTVSSARVPAGYKSQRAQAPSPFARPIDTDDYVTSTTDGSDIESYIDKRRRRRHDDEDLLFKEGGYGQTGGGLPGLFDSGSVDDSEATPMWSSVRAATASNKHSTRARPPTSAPRFPESSSARRAPPVSFPNWEYDDDDTSSSLTVSESDPDLRSRSDSGATVDLSRILSGDGRYDPEEGALDEKLNVRLAVRLRKELKRRERNATRRQTLQSRAAQEDYEQGHVADSEA